MAPPAGRHRVNGWRSALALGVAITLVVMAVAAALTAAQQPTYTASAVIAVSIPHTGVERAPAMGTQREVAASLLVAQSAARRLSGGDPSELRKDLRVTVPVDTNVLHLEFDAPTPGAARTGAAAFASAYLDYRSQQGPASPSAAFVISPATLPEKPSRPNWVVNLAAAGVLGLGLGGAAAYAQLLRRRRSDEADVVDLPMEVLAVVPRDGLPWLKPRPRQDGTAEHYRRLRAHLLAMTGRTPGFSSVLVTSARGRRSTMTVALQLGAALAAAGYRTVVVTAGDQNAAVPVPGAKPKAPGLWHVLAEDRAPTEVLVATPVAGLSVLPRGTSTSLSDLLAGSGLAGTFARLSHVADFVLVDAPGVLTSSAALEVAGDVSSAIVVLDDEEDVDDIVSTVAELGRRRAHVLGCVVTAAGGLSARLARFARPATWTPPGPSVIGAEPRVAAAPPPAGPVLPKEGQPPAAPTPAPPPAPAPVQAPTVAVDEPARTVVLAGREEAS